MNARSEVFELCLEGRQVQEAVSGIFHTLLFHRTLGKFHYKEEGSYSVGTVGFEDITCDFVDFTYVRCASDELNETLTREIVAFSERLRSHDGPRSGNIGLEFYQKRRGRWLLLENIPWEVWNIRINILTLPNEQERQRQRVRLGEQLAEKVIAVAASLNRQQYLPKVPSEPDLELVFDTHYRDIQPYHFKVISHTSGPSNNPSSVGSTMRKLLKDTLAF
uniref:Autophagy-related protein 101 n=1 Tax=Amblyomma sculptum TaxID=1581419 RepID=A0A1E1XVN6_AMBSC